MSEHLVWVVKATSREIRAHLGCCMTILMTDLRQTNALEFGCISLAPET
jgi:hypothetical protein